MKIIALKCEKLYWAAPVVSGYALLCFAVMFVHSILPDKADLTFMSWFRSPMRMFFQWEDMKTYVQFLTHVVGHANWSHFGNNFVFLMLLGIQAEEHYGSKLIFKLIVLTSLSISLINIVITGTPVIGASGIVFLFITLSLFADREEKRAPVEAVIMSVYFIGREVVDMFGVDRTSQLAHFLGAVIGFIYGYWMQDHPDRIKSKAVQ